MGDSQNVPNLPRHDWLRTVAAASVAFMAVAAAARAQATEYPLTSADDPVVGENQKIVTVYEDTLYDLARKYGIGTEELIRVNPGLDPWLPGAGKQIIIPDRHILPPGPREGIVVNLPEHRLYYYPKPKRGAPIEVITYPVGIGKMDWRTPLGLTHVSQKEKNPTWTPPKSIRTEHALADDPLPAHVPPGPKNPLGLYAMRLAVGDGTYLIHGTNNPIAVGMPVTHGCIRMYPDDVAALFPLVPVGTPVRLVNEPNIDEFSQLLQAKVGDSTVATDWDYAREVLEKADGVIATVSVEVDRSAISTEPSVDKDK